MERLCKHSTSSSPLYHRPPEPLPNIKGSRDLYYKEVNNIAMHCGVAYESVHLLARGHMIRVCKLACGGPRRSGHGQLSDMFCLTCFRVLPLHVSVCIQ